MFFDQQLPSTSQTHRQTKNPKLADLNDDCLITLFRYLPLGDLNAVGATCHRFHDIVVNSVYQHQSNLQNLSIRTMERSCKRKGHWTGLPYNVDCIKSYLKRFGRLIKHIDFDNTYFIRTNNTVYTKEVFALIANYCSSTLQSLKTRDVILFSDSILNCLLVFLKLIKFETDDHLNWQKCLPLCPNLKELTLRLDARPDIPFQLHFICPKLTVFRLLIGDGNETQQVHWLPANMDLFFQRHPNITSLSLDLSLLFNAAIIGQLKHLEELNFGILNYHTNQPSLDLQSFYDLTKLRKINVTNYCGSFQSQFLNQSASAETLEHLTISTKQIDASFIDGLTRFPHLHHLSLTLDFDGAMDIPNSSWRKLHRLNSLNELHLSNNDPRFYAKFVVNLTGAHRSLHTFTNRTYYMSKLDDKFILALGKFQNLQKLKMEINRVDSGIPYNWKSIQCLTQLKEFNTTFSKANCLRHFFNNLGARDTLEKLKIGHFTVNKKFFQSLVRFSNLREIKWAHIKNFYPENFEVLGQLHRIRKIHISLETSDLAEFHSKLPNDLFIDLVNGWPALEKFKLYINVHSADDCAHKFYEKNIDLRKKLVAIFKSRKSHFRYADITVESTFLRIKLSN